MNAIARLVKGDSLKGRLAAISDSNIIQLAHLLVYLLGFFAVVYAIYCTCMAIYGSEDPEKMRQMVESSRVWQTVGTLVSSILIMNAARTVSLMYSSSA